MRQYRIFGYVGGEIWMPSELCWKRFDTGWFTWEEGPTYTPPRNGFPGTYPDYRTVLLDIVGDGDFQSCGIVQATVEIQETRGRGTWRRSMELKGRDENKDCWVRPKRKRERILSKIEEEFVS